METIVAWVLMTFIILLVVSGIVSQLTGLKKPPYVRTPEEEKEKQRIRARMRNDYHHFE